MTKEVVKAQKVNMSTPKADFYAGCPSTDSMVLALGDFLGF
jgi:hypothetical protein